MNSWNNPTVQAAFASVPSPPQSSTILNQDSLQLQGLLTLLKQNQDQSNGSGKNDLLDLLNLAMKRDMQQSQQQQFSLPPSLQQQSIQTLHSVTPPPPQLSPTSTRQQIQTANLQSPLSFPTQSTTDMIKASNKELEAMIQCLQRKLAPVAPSLSQSGSSSVIFRNDQRTNLPSLANASKSQEKFDSATSIVMSNTMKRMSPSISSCSVKKSKPTDPKLVASSLAPPPHYIAGCTSGKQILLYRDIDEFYLTEYQCLLRQQIELFEATNEDLQASAQGRNSPIQAAQVGIRCKHCSALPIRCRSRGAVYFPRSIDGIYQVAQNLTKIHLCNSCNRVPENIRKKLTELSKVNKRASGGKRYWIERVREIGIYEDGKAIRFKKA